MTGGLFLFEVTAPDGRKLRMRALSKAGLEADLQEGYVVTGDILGAFPDNTGGLVIRHDIDMNEVVTEFLERFWPTIDKWLREFSGPHEPTE